MRTSLIFCLAGALAVSPPLTLARAQYMHERAYCGRTVELWTAERCPWCAKAKEFFARLAINYEEVDYGPLWNAPPGGVPQIFVDGYRIMGYDEQRLRAALCVR